MNPMKERVSILIDGANFYLQAFKKVGIHDAEFDFEAFTEFLGNGREISHHGKRYYIGTVSEKIGDPKSRKAISRQTALLTKLAHTGWEVKTSKHRKRIEEIVIDSSVANWEIIRSFGIERIRIERHREKGIDVKLATDLIVGAVDDQYDTAIVVSSDTDLIPAIDWVRNRIRKKVEYVGFSIPDVSDNSKSVRPSRGMISKTDGHRVLVESDLRRFVIPTTSSSRPSRK
jgi:uncharacterized LabA/DUF88 family protein